MTELLRQVMAEVERLPPDQQDKIAALIQLELEEWEWDALVATPQSQRFLDLLVEEARRDEAAGRLRDLEDTFRDLNRKP